MIDRLVEQVLAVAGTRIALELQWSTYEDDSDRPSWVLELHVIYEQAGRHHSEYSTVGVHTFPAEELDERREAHRIAGAVADRVRLPLHAPPIDKCGGQDGSNFLRSTPATRTAGYVFDWEATWWTTDGRCHVAAGDEIVDADSGELACAELQRRLVRWPYRPLSIVIKGEGSHGGNVRYVEQGEGTPDWRVVRLAAREDTRASTIARRFPDTTPLALMLGFADAFLLWLDRFADLARWRAGEIDDAALDAALAPLIADRRRVWERSLILQDRRAAGESVAAYVRSELGAGCGRLELIRDLRDAFDLGLHEAKMFVEAAGERDHDDAELDAQLGAST